MVNINHSRTFSAVLNPISGGGFEVSFPDFPGCVTFGHTLQEAKEKGAEVLQLWIEELNSQNRKIPKKAKQPIITKINVAIA